MNNKQKKSILQIVLIFAFAFFITSNFSPIVYFSYSEAQIERGKAEEIDAFDYKTEMYHFFSIYYAYDLSYSKTQGVGIENEEIILGHFYSIHLKEGRSRAESSGYYSKDAGDTSLRETLILKAAFLLLLIFLYILFFVYAYQSFKKVPNTHSKAPLYVGILIIMVTIFITLTLAINLYFFEHLRMFIPHIKIHYGFYYTMISGILFLVVFYLQKYITYDEKKRN